MALGDDFSFHQFGGGDSGGGGQPAAPQPSVPTPPTNPQTGHPSSMPIAGPSSKVGPGTYKGTQFAQSGVGKYFNRNTNGAQFNTPAIVGSLQKGYQAYEEAKYYRRAGFGPAIRNTLGMGPPPSHMSDTIQTRQRQQNRTVTGLNPQPGVARPTSHLETQADQGADW
jgi:hypothetical protein